MTKSLVRTLIVGFCMAAAVTCGDSDPVDPGNGGEEPTAKENPTFAGDIQDIFNRGGCTASNCHGQSPGQASLNLSAGSAYAQLVNVPSSQNGTFTRVVPSDANASLLYLKVSQANPPVGVRMPPGGQLSSVDQQNIRNWINNGAPDN